MSHLRIGLRPLLIAALIVLTVGPACVSGFTYTGGLRAEAERLAANGLQARAEIVASQLARRIHGVWDTAFRFASELDPRDPEAMRQVFTLMPRIEDRVTWVGFAAVDGTLKVTTNGQGEGTNVAQEHWFRHGLLGPYAGDEQNEAHESSTRSFDPGDRAPRIIDFAVPVKNAAGDVVGVFGAHVGWDWVREQVRALGNDITDVMLVSRERRVLAGPDAFEGKTLNNAAAVAAGQVKTLTRMETWPDGKSYLTVVIPAEQYKNLPNFGWSVILRRDIQSVLAPTRTLIREFWRSLGIEIVISLTLAILLAFWVTTPLRRLARYAVALAKGEEDGAPHEETRFREAAMLSASLVQVQSQLASPPVIPLLPRESAAAREAPKLRELSTRRGPASPDPSAHEPSKPRDPPASREPAPREPVISLNKLRSLG